MKIAVCVDSGSGITKEEADKLGLYFLPLQIMDDEQVFLDGLDVDKDEIFDMIRAGRNLKTSMPPLGMIKALFRDLKQQGYDHVINVPLTSGISSTAHTVAMCAEEEGLPLTTIDSYSTVTIQKYLAISAKKLVDQEKALVEIVETLEDALKHSNSLIIPDDLDHLKRGGRLTPLAATLAGMLKIKPILQINKSTEGKIDTFAKVRTMSKAMKQSVETFQKEGVDETYMLILFHADAPALAQEYKSIYFGAFPGNETMEELMGPVISVHTGIGCVGIQYIKKI